MRGLGTFLIKEIRWGRLSWMALVAALLFIVASPISEGFFALLPLLIFTAGGVLVERTAPRHPYVNSLVFGLLGVILAVLLSLLQSMGAERELPSFYQIGAALIILATFIPQSLVGTFIAVTIRRGREMGQKDGEKTAAKGKKQASDKAGAGKAQKRKKGRG